MHESFANNADATLNSLYGAFMANYRYITPLNLNGTVILFKELGRPDQALEMIKTYVEGRDEGRDFSRSGTEIRLLAAARTLML